jgi:ribosomal protein L11 methyltransferase
MVPTTTYELKVSFFGSPGETNETKQLLLAWLPANGVESFVEGYVDSLDIDHDGADLTRDFYAESGGPLSPISIFDYDLPTLQEVERKIRESFGTRVKIENLSQETSTWMEGWKDSFKPIKTDRFYIYPPWDKPADFGGRIPLEIEPGMAFGTGQHATTQLCLRQIERVAAQMEDIGGLRFMDVGTGSGILAIGAKKLGFGQVFASDIEAAAVHAAKDNAKINQTEISVWKGSVPVPCDERDLFHTPYQVVVANILIVVLERIIFDIAEITESGGRLILSGLLQEQEPQMIEMAEEAGFGHVESHYDGDWACLELEKLV